MYFGKQLVQLLTACFLVALTLAEFNLLYLYILLINVHTTCLLEYNIFLTGRNKFSQVTEFMNGNGHTNLDQIANFTKLAWIVTFIIRNMSSEFPTIIHSYIKTLEFGRQNVSLLFCWGFVTWLLKCLKSSNVNG